MSCKVTLFWFLLLPHNLNGFKIGIIEYIILSQFETAADNTLFSIVQIYRYANFHQGGGCIHDSDRLSFYPFSNNNAKALQKDSSKLQPIEQQFVKNGHNNELISLLFFDLEKI